MRSGDGTAKPYDFQLSAGTTDISLYQIPEQELGQLSTETLVETILANPFLIQFEAYDSSKTALDMYMENFNVYPALFQSADCEEVLLKLYDKAQVVKPAEDAKAGSEAYFRVQNIEILLAAKFAENESQGIATEAAVTEEFDRIHEEKTKQREAAADYAPDDGYLWFEENYF